MCLGSFLCSFILFIILERLLLDDKVLVWKVFIVDIGVIVLGFMDVDDVDDVDIFFWGKL